MSVGLPCRGIRGACMHEAMNGMLCTYVWAGVFASALEPTQVSLLAHNMDSSMHRCAHAKVQGFTHARSSCKRLMTISKPPRERVLQVGSTSTGASSRIHINRCFKQDPHQRVLQVGSTSTGASSRIHINSITVRLQNVFAFEVWGCSRYNTRCADGHTQSVDACCSDAASTMHAMHAKTVSSTVAYPSAPPRPTALDHCRACCTALHALCGMSSVFSVSASNLAALAPAALPPLFVPAPTAHEWHVDLHVSYLRARLWVACSRRRQARPYTSSACPPSCQRASPAVRASTQVSKLRGADASGRGAGARGPGRGWQAARAARLTGPQAVTNSRGRAAGPRQSSAAGIFPND
eukprot:351077-Chlamydomonas_euryale.AAC.4